MQDSATSSGTVFTCTSCICTCLTNMTNSCSLSCNNNYIVHPEKDNLYRYTGIQVYRYIYTAGSASLVEE